MGSGSVDFPGLFPSPQDGHRCFWLGDALMIKSEVSRWHGQVVLPQFLLCLKLPCGCCTSNSHNCCTAQHQTLGTIRNSGPSQQGASRQALTPDTQQDGLGGGIFAFFLAYRFVLTLPRFHHCQPSPCLLQVCGHFGGVSFAFSGQVARGITAVGTLMPPQDLKFVLPRLGWCRAVVLHPSTSPPSLFHFAPHTTLKHPFFPHSRALKVSRKAEILSPLGALYYNTGRYEEALQVYREAAALQPSNKDIRLALVSVGPGQGHDTGAAATGCSPVYDRGLSFSRS